MGRKLWIFTLSVLALGFYAQRRLGFSPVYKSDKDLTGKTVLITGGNAGIGEAAAMEFAKLGAKVVIASRNDEKSEIARKNITEETNNKNIYWYHLDLEDFDSVRNFAKRFDKEHEHLDYLINNAGVLTVRGVSSNGYTRVFNINHLGHFLLTDLLMKKMTKQGKKRPVRIINVSSEAYRFVRRMDYDEIKKSANNPIGDFISYGYSKLANVYFTAELHRRYAGAGITAYAIHPGMVKTEIGDNLSGALKVLAQIATYGILRTPFLGAQTIMYCALDNDVTTESGSYFEDNAFSALPDFAKDREAAEKLWDFSIEVTKAQ